MIELSDIAQSFYFINGKGFSKASYRYESEEFGNANLIMVGPIFSLRFERDRGQVFVDIGDSKTGWEKLEYALIFVDEKITEVQLGEPPDVNKLGELCKTHWKEIALLYEQGTNLPAFREFCKIRSNALISRIFPKF